MSTKRTSSEKFNNEERQLRAFFNALRRPGSDVVEVQGTFSDEKNDNADAHFRSIAQM